MTNAWHFFTFLRSEVIQIDNTQTLIYASFGESTRIYECAGQILQLISMHEFDSHLSGILFFPVAIETEFHLSIQKAIY